MEGTTGLVGQDTSANRDLVTERKPYFLTFFKDSSSQRGLDGIIQYDVISNSLSFKRLPSELQYTDDIDLAPHAAEGLILCKHPKNTGQWCVYNTHTRTNTPVSPPPAPQLDPNVRNQEFCGMVVDTSKDPYAFDLVFADNIYRHSSNSAATVFKRLFPSEPVWYFRMCHKGCMYKSTKKAVDGVLKYSMKDSQWIVMGGPMFRGEERTFLGAWSDHVFTVVHDSQAKCVAVWELIGSQTEYKWVKYASCSRAQYKQLIELPGVGQRPSDWPILVSVFCEEYLLIYNREYARSIRCVLFNLKSKTWVLSLPEVTMEAILEADASLSTH